MQPTNHPQSRSALADLPVTQDPVQIAPTEADTGNAQTAGRKSWLPFAYALWGFACTTVLAPYYTAGDQTYYRAFYDSRDGADLIDSFTDYSNMLGTKEPAYFLLVMLFSSWLQKDALMSLINALFGFYLGRGLVALNTSRVVAATLALNYYLLVLYLAADRLKLGILFLLVGAAHPGLPRYFAYVLSVLSQVQNVLLVVGRLLANLVPTLLPLVRGRLRTQLFWAPVALVIVSVPLFFLREHSERKLEIYMLGTAQGSFSLLKPIAFLFFTVLYAPGRRIEAVAMHLPVLFGSALVGVERLVLFSYFIFMFYGIQVRRGLNFGVLVSSLYFVVTGVVFIFDVVTYGTGFYWTTPPILRLFG